MTNLNLPTLTHANLDRLLKGRSERKIAFETHAVRYGGGDAIGVFHHRSLIAVVSPTAVQLVHAGWSSRTTSMRMNRVCTDNGLAQRVGIRQGALCLIEGRHAEPLPRDRRLTLTLV